MTRAAILREVGPMLFGESWQRPLARSLGEFHPSGVREHIDDRLVRRWVAEERPIPEWVWPALTTLLKRRAYHIAVAQRSLEGWPR